MKLKKTLSMLIGGICLVAATTVALAGPVCYRCDTVTRLTSQYPSYRETCTYYVNGKSYTCRHNANYYGAAYICPNCDMNYGWVQQLQRIKTTGHSKGNCPMY